jgi:ribulose-phosphate 3-epimerase
MASKELILSPSLLASDFGRINEELAALQEAGIQWVHWDVMDGAFVPNITMGPDIIAATRAQNKLFYDVHLMIEKPERYVQKFVDAGADLICVHAEATNHLDRVVKQIGDAYVKPAVALNPGTPLQHVQYLLPDLEMVLLMSVNPGFGGQTFIPYSLQRIRDLKAMIREAGAQTLIQVDGGVTPENVADVMEAGADVVVTGTAFFNFPPYKERLQTFITLSTTRLPT